MSNEEYLTSKIFVEYYNKLVLEINKIIKRIEKIENNYESLSNNSSFYNLKKSGNLNNNLKIKAKDYNDEVQQKKINETPNTKKKKKLNNNKENNRTKSLNQKENIFNILDKIKIISSDSAEHTPKGNDNDSNYNYDYDDIQNINAGKKKKLIEASKRFKKIKKNVEGNNEVDIKTSKTLNRKSPNKDNNNEFSFKNILAQKQSNQNSLSDLKANNSKLLSNNRNDIKSKMNKTYLKKDNDNKINIKFSSIIKTFSEKKLLLSSVPPNPNKNNNNLKFQLIYKASIDGDSTSDFHELCDNETDVIVAIETEEGRRFGGYTKIGFDSSCKSKIDEYAFLFSFDKMKIYRIMKGFKAIVCYPQSGPCFFGSKNDIIHIGDNFLTNYSHTEKKNNTYESMEEDYELNNGEPQFLVKELEIFKIL